MGLLVRICVNINKNKKGDKMKKWIKNGLHFIEVGGHVYVLREDMDREIEKVIKLLEGEE